VQLQCLGGKKARLRHFLAFKFPVGDLLGLAHLIVVPFQGCIAGKLLIVDLSDDKHLVKRVKKLSAPVSVVSDVCTNLGLQAAQLLV
jgi:hypothetical protein